ncbi:helix-turn-helix domain-containing protein [Leptospira wolffii]|uniref:helix-turn-helix transcriptional regulator n=1 Tax=Leptospira wolffii TaxID=409998 RepID=UPI0010830F70|nr:helix-turn-helix transcriptional regulator [Leptospira wolffii]TGK59197.1 helix-turn-helix domain-containing protein [Leptospira wolffii]TGK71422.1 helix-turn-helix domain-containing protein [Leptospira wolffii]TGL29301.1 helix-turn-helix domain-containing protein [Leptospira wolffii]
MAGKSKNKSQSIVRKWPKSEIIRRISEEEKKAFYHQLKVARIEANLTQAQVGKMIKRSRSQVSKIESGKCRLYMDEFLKFMKIYKKSPFFFYSVFTTNEVIKSQKRARVKSAKQF